MIKLIKSHYDKEDGMSFVKITTDLGCFDGYAFLNPEDKEIASKYLGCEIAELRAHIEYFKKRKYIINQRLTALKGLRKKFKKYISTNMDYADSIMDSALINILNQQIAELERSRNLCKQSIKDINKYIDTAIDERLDFLEKIEKRKQDN